MAGRVYNPPEFREDQPEVLHQVIKEHSFATLISQARGELMATHLPVLLDAEDGPLGTLRGHVARANPHWRAFREGVEALAIFQGPHTYVSPSWYETELTVPTWNYVAVHAYGRPRVIEDEAGLKAILLALVDTYESGFERPWSIQRLPEEFVQKMLKGIVGFEIPIARLEGKFKMNQNRTAGDRRGVIDALSNDGSEMSLSVAKLMVDREGKEGK